MGSESPDVPIHSGEVRAALDQAQELGWDLPHEMEMEQVLAAAFNYRGGRLNHTLRQEAQALRREVATLQNRAGELRQEIADSRGLQDDLAWAEAISSRLQEFLDSIRLTPVIRLAEEYRALCELMDERQS